MGSWKLWLEMHCHEKRKTWVLFFSPPAQTLSNQCLEHWLERCFNFIAQQWLRAILPHNSSHLCATHHNTVQPGRDTLMRCLFPSSVLGFCAACAWKTGSSGRTSSLSYFSGRQDGWKNHIPCALTLFPQSSQRTAWIKTQCTERELIVFSWDSFERHLFLFKGPAASGILLLIICQHH